MSNHLSVDKVQSILQLHQQGWSQRRIASALGVDRKAVRRHLRISEAEEQPQIPSKGTRAPTGSSEPKGCQSASTCAPFRTVIEQMLGQGLSAQRIYQDLRNDQGYDGSYYSVRRVVQSLRQADRTRSMMRIGRFWRHAGGARRPRVAVRRLRRPVASCG